MSGRVPGSEGRDAYTETHEVDSYRGKGEGVRGQRLCRLRQKSVTLMRTIFARSRPHGDLEVLGLQNVRRARGGGHTAIESTIDTRRQGVAAVDARG